VLSTGSLLKAGWTHVGIQFVAVVLLLATRISCQAVGARNAHKLPHMGRHLRSLLLRAQWL
jgi:hypothetical protein